MNRPSASTPATLESRKFGLSTESAEAVAAGHYLEAAHLKRTIAEICRRQGKERDAHLLEVGAYQLLTEHYDACHQPTLDRFVELARKAQRMQRREQPCYWKEPMIRGHEASVAQRALESIDGELAAIHQERLSEAAANAEARADDLVAAKLKVILAGVCRAVGKERDAHLLEIDAKRLENAEQRRRTAQPADPPCP